MTQSDKWKKRPCVVRYFNYANELREYCKRANITLSERLSVTFVLPMAASWSDKKRREFDGKYHKSRPDLDNLLKAFQDALCDEDSHISHYVDVKKIWGVEGKIILESEH